MKTIRILAINPGSTSTKVAVYEDETLIKELTLRHSSEELSRFATVTDQFDFRMNIILDAVRQAGIDIRTFDAIIGRGGLVKPIPSGVYEVNEALKHDLRESPVGQHASNLGGLIAAEIAAKIGARAFIADPVVVDELQDEARICGLPELERISIFHALNQKAIARAYAKSKGVAYESLSLIIAHMGGGISVGAHRQGRVVDVNNALNGNGPFSPERAGSLPAGQLVKMCFSGKYTYDQVRKMLAGRGGFVAHLNTNDTQEVIRRMEAGDAKARLVLNAMCYNTAKYIGAMATVLEGAVDAIILTGGIAYNACVCDYISQCVRFIAPVVVLPGENELEALAQNALRVMRGEEEPKVYGA